MLCVFSLGACTDYKSLFGVISYAVQQQIAFLTVAECSVSTALSYILLSKHFLVSVTTSQINVSNRIQVHLFPQWNKIHQKTCPHVSACKQ